MVAVRFKALTGSGAIVRGTLEAPSEAMAARMLRSEGKFPITTSLGSAFDPAFLKTRFAQRGFGRRLAIATQELASLLGSGVELDRALSIVAALGDLGTLRDTFAKVRTHVHDGDSFAEALAAQPEISPFFVSMVRSGEAGGALEKTMTRLADYLQRSVAIRETILSALFYPAILFVSAGFSIGVIVFVVLPEFEPMFADAGQQMPFMARTIMGIGDLLRDWWWLLAGSFVAAALWLRRALRSDAFRRRLHARLFRLPMLGSLLRAMEVERFLRSVGTSLQNGVALPFALTLAKDVLWHLPLTESVGATAASLREGESLSTRLGQSGIFPGETLDIVRIGEETGRLDEMLLRQADFDERRIKNRTDRLLALLVPLITVLLGVMVGGLIAAMLTAILSVNDLALQ